MKDFIFKPFEEMTNEDYKNIGFKSGLEIHQQLYTEKKLFCRCPAGKYSKKFDAEILRHMRPTLSELGEYDGTALMEFKTKKDIIYKINRETVCTYEMDDTPPFLINEDALDAGIKCALLFDCKIVDEMHIIRKQYLDGSIPTGFQRTSIYAIDGAIPYKDKKIDIIQMSIEEDSCREISDTGHIRVYNTDRLGMPLIETVTAPQMKTPSEVAEVANVCKKIVQSTGVVRTGSGAAREDVNVSVEGGTRIEIKGVPQISLIPILTYNEAMRQWNLLRLKNELEKRGITEKKFQTEFDDVTRICKKTKYLPIKSAVSSGLKVKAVLLKGFKDLLNWQTQTDTHFSKEISDRVRVIACLTNLPNIIHSDSKSDNIASAEWQAIRKFMNADDNDTIVLVWGNEIDSETAVKEIIIRAKEATIGVPSETRQALDDGTNGFERILPGPDRMYPDTDLPPKKIENSRVEKIKKTIPEKFWIREKWYAELNIPADIIEPLSISAFADVFKKAVLELKINPVLAAVTVIQFPKRLKKQGLDISKLTPEIFDEIFVALAKDEIPKDSILYILYDYLKTGKLIMPEKIDESEIDEPIKFAAGELKKVMKYKNNDKTELLFGLVMNKLRKNVNGKIVKSKIEKYLNSAEVING